MGDQLMTREDLERTITTFTTTLTTLTEQMTTLEYQVKTATTTGISKEIWEKNILGFHEAETVVLLFFKIQFLKKKNHMRKRMIGLKEFLDWQIEVDRFFKVMGIHENKQVKMVVIRLKSTTVIWWDKLAVQRQMQRKGLVRTWQRMKQLMLERFLLEDYE
ncbi:hypothetical protein KIW84_057709 [Lathyrus oleraceus]|uniref:Retrotransposon gag domain-containing protein n=1 Tax=Pisum sativum TaxID=3888 RepID=A0A9D4X6N2_PEA|nr:hypothetical protein KIW84_057709 [Pisum sativum]